MRQLTYADLSSSFVRIDPVLFRADLDAADRILISDVLSFHLEGKIYFKTIASIAALTHVSERHVTRKLKRLHDMEYLTITIHKKSQFQTNNIQIGPSTIKLFIPTGDIESVTTSEPVKVIVETPKAEPAKADPVTPEPRTPPAPPNPVVLQPKTVPVAKDQGNNTHNSTEPNGMLVNGIWYINENGPLPKTFTTPEHAEQIWSAYGLDPAGGRAWWAKYESADWLYRGQPMKDPRWMAAHTAKELAKERDEKKRAEDLSARVSGGAMTHVTDFLPTDVFRSLDFNPSYGVSTPSESDAIKVLGLYGVSQSLAQETYRGIQWPEGNRLDHLRAIGADLKASAKRATVPEVAPRYDYDDICIR